MKDDLGKRKLCARFVPHYLTLKQRENRVTCCQDIIMMTNAVKNFLTKILQETRPVVLPMIPPKKQQSSEWVGETSPWPKKLQFQRSCIKNMLTFFDTQGMVHKEFIPEGKTVNA